MQNVLHFVAVMFLFAAAAHGEELPAEAREVWKLEEAYYRYAKNNDPQSYLSLFSDKVVGWPAMDPRPKGKDAVSQWIGKVHSNPEENWQYELQRLAIQSFGDVVVVHYRLRDYFVSAQSGEEIRSEYYRISHTWLRREGKWQLISGMGGAYN